MAVKGTYRVDHGKDRTATWSIARNLMVNCGQFDSIRYTTVLLVISSRKQEIRNISCFWWIDSVGWIVTEQRGLLSVWNIQRIQSFMDFPNIYYATNTQTRYTVRHFTLFSYAVRLHLWRNDKLRVVSLQTEVRNIRLAIKIKRTIWFLPIVWLIYITSLRKYDIYRLISRLARL